MARFSEGDGWVAFDAGVENAQVTRAAVDGDGALLLAGLDLSECDSAACTWESGGDRAAVWIGTME
jgi:hypothetical protein